MIRLVRVITITFFFTGILAITAGAEERAGALFTTQLSERIQALEERVTELEFSLNHALLPPRIAYDSGWRTFLPNSSETLHHNVGGNTDRYVVLLDERFDQEGENWGFGGFVNNFGDLEGFSYSGLTSQDVTINSHWDEVSVDLRLRIIVY